MVLAGAGAGYAAGQIGTSDIADGAVTSTKVHESAITSTRVRDGSLQPADLSANTVRALQVRAWTSVVVSPRAAIEPARTKGFSRMTRPATGVYCLTLSDSSIDPARTAPVVTVDWDNSSGANLSAYLSKSAFGCPAGTDIGVRTFAFKAGKPNRPTNTVAFTVLVP